MTSSIHIYYAVPAPRNVFWGETGEYTAKCPMGHEAATSDKFCKECGSSIVLDALVRPTGPFAVLCESQNVSAQEAYNALSFPGWGWEAKTTEGATVTLSLRLWDVSGFQYDGAPYYKTPPLALGFQVAKLERAYNYDGQPLEILHEALQVLRSPLVEISTQLGIDQNPRMYVQTYIET